MDISRLGIRITSDQKYVALLRQCYIYARRSNLPATVRIEDGRKTRLDIDIDTGIR